MQGQQQWLAAREGSIPSNSQKTFVPEFFLLLFSWQMPLLCSWMLSSRTTSTGQANAHKVAAHQVCTFLRDCLSIKELILLLQVGSTAQRMEPRPRRLLLRERDVLMVEPALAQFRQRAEPRAPRGSAPRGGSLSLCLCAPATASQSEPLAGLGHLLIALQLYGELKFSGTGPGLCLILQTCKNFSIVL